MPSKLPSLVKADVRAYLALFRPVFEEIYREKRVTEQSLTGHTMDSGFEFSMRALADYIVASRKESRPTDLFMMLASGVTTPRNAAVTSVLKTEYSRLLDAAIDRPQFVRLPGGGFLVHTPEGTVAVGARSLSEHPAIGRAVVLIPSRSLFIYPTPHLAPLALFALVHGKRVAFENMLQIGQLKLRRDGDFKLEIVYDNKTMGTVSLFEGYSKQIAALSDPNAYMSAWRDFLKQVLERVDEIQGMINKLLANGGTGDGANDIGLIIARIQALMQILSSTQRAFYKSQIRGSSWEKFLVEAQLAHMSNAITTLNLIPAFFKDRSITDDDLRDAVKYASNLFLPLAYLDKSVVLRPQTKRWLQIDIPEDLPEEPLLANPIAMREIVDEIVWRAGERNGTNAPAHISFGYDEQMKRLIVENRSNASDPFRHFEATREGRPWLEFLVSQLGADTELCFRPAADSAERISAIEISLPKASGPEEARRGSSHSTSGNDGEPCAEGDGIGAAGGAYSGDLFVAIDDGMGTITGLNGIASAPEILLASYMKPGV